MLVCLATAWSPPVRVEFQGQSADVQPTETLLQAFLRLGLELPPLLPGRQLPALPAAQREWPRAAQGRRTPAPTPAGQGLPLELPVPARIGHGGGSAPGQRPDHRLRADRSAPHRRRLHLAEVRDHPGAQLPRRPVAGDPSARRRTAAPAAQSGPARAVQLRSPAAPAAAGRAPPSGCTRTRSGSTSRCRAPLAPHLRQPPASSRHPSPTRPCGPPWTRAARSAPCSTISTPRSTRTPEMKPFFHGVTQQRAADKQYAFLKQLMTGEKAYFGDRPRNAHHRMVITRCAVRPPSGPDGGHPQAPWPG